MRFEKIIAWYASQCNGDWEHQHGFKVSTLDNPGLRLQIDLEGTPLQYKAFTAVEIDLDSSTGWLFCEKTPGNTFDGRCDTSMFGYLIDIFLDWAAEGQGRAKK